MKFGISFAINHDLQKSSDAVSQFADGLSKELKNESFGSDVEDISIGVIWIRSVEGYEDWFKERKPRHRKKQTIRLSDGWIETLKNTFSYDIKFTDSEIEEIASSEARAIALFNKRLLDSLRNFETPSMRKRDFDLIRFKKRICTYINNQQNQSVAQRKTSGPAKDVKRTKQKTSRLDS